nr:beta-ketoacyl synthase N-terminal-like domain-containing protein [Angustibacter aerolatus]
MAPTKRIVVTGLGATTPIGGDVPSTWQAALDGVSGGRTLTQDWVAQHEPPVTFGAPALVPAADVLPKVEIRRQDPSAQFALIAAREAWADAGTPDTPPERLGVVLATGIGGIWTLLDQWDNLREKGPRRVFPLTVPMLMPNGSAAAISIEPRRAGRHPHPGQRLRVRCRGDRLRGADDPRRSRRRRGGRRHRGRDPPGLPRRVRRHAGAVDAQRRPGRGQPSLRREPRRLRARRGRRRRGARVGGARPRPRREDLRRGRRRRHVERRVPHRGPRPGGRRRRQGDARGPGRGRRLRRRRRARQRPLHVDAGR